MATPLGAGQGDPRPARRRARELARRRGHPGRVRVAGRGGEEGDVSGPGDGRGEEEGLILFLFLFFFSFCHVNRLTEYPYPKYAYTSFLFLFFGDICIACMHGPLHYITYTYIYA